MRPEILKFFHDILGSIDSINAYLGKNRDFNVYISNKMMRRAVEREIEIIGEAMNQVLKLDPKIKISSAQQIIGMRNRVIHGYDDVDNQLVWGTIQRHLPILRSEVEDLLNT